MAEEQSSSGGGGGGVDPTIEAKRKEIKARLVLEGQLAKIALSDADDDDKFQAALQLRQRKKEAAAKAHRQLMAQADAMNKLNGIETEQKIAQLKAAAKEGGGKEKPLAFPKSSRLQPDLQRQTEGFANVGEEASTAFRDIQGGGGVQQGKGLPEALPFNVSAQVDPAGFRPASGGALIPNTLRQRTSFNVQPTGVTQGEEAMIGLRNEELQAQKDHQAEQLSIARDEQNTRDFLGRQGLRLKIATDIVPVFGSDVGNVLIGQLQRGEMISIPAGTQSIPEKDAATREIVGEASRLRAQLALDEMEWLTSQNMGDPNHLSFGEMVGGRGRVQKGTGANRYSMTRRQFTTSRGVQAGADQGDVFSNYRTIFDDDGVLKEGMNASLVYQASSQMMISKGLFPARKGVDQTWYEAAWGSVDEAFSVPGTAPDSKNIQLITENELLVSIALAKGDIRDPSNVNAGAEAIERLQKWGYAEIETVNGQKFLHPANSGMMSSVAKMAFDMYELTKMENKSGGTWQDAFIGGTEHAGGLGLTNASTAATVPQVEAANALTEGALQQAAGTTNTGFEEPTPDFTEGSLPPLPTSQPPREGPGAIESAFASAVSGLTRDRSAAFQGATAPGGPGGRLAARAGARQQKIEDVFPSPSFSPFPKRNEPAANRVLGSTSSRQLAEEIVSEVGQQLSLADKEELIERVMAALDSRSSQTFSSEAALFPLIREALTAAEGRDSTLSKALEQFSGK